MLSRFAYPVLVSGLFALAGCNPEEQTVGAQAPATPRPEPAAKSIATAPEPNAPVKAPAPAVEQVARAARPAEREEPATESVEKAENLPTIKLSGARDQATAKFDLQAGLSLWTMTHDGRSNVKMSLLTADGNSVDMPLNEIGRFRGTRVVRVPKTGTYLVNVEADGKWTVTIEEPRPTTAPAKPLAASSKGTNVTPFVTLTKGLAVFKAAHKGNGVFRVRIFTRDGKYFDQVVGVIGRYDGSRAVTIQEDGIYIIGVSANGDWSLNID